MSYCIVSFYRLSFVTTIHNEGIYLHIPPVSQHCPELLSYLHLFRFFCTLTTMFVSFRSLLIHESAELLGTVLPFTTTITVLCFSLLGRRRLSFFFSVGARLDRKNDVKESTQKSPFGYCPLLQKKNNSCTERTKDRHLRPIRSLRQVRDTTT